MRNIIRQTILPVVAVSLLCATLAVSTAWGEKYFPNIPLITQDGENGRFFDDVIKDKIVAINSIYTRCPDTCPLETAQLVKVQEILGDRVGEEEMKIKQEVTIMNFIRLSFIALTALFAHEVLATKANPKDTPSGAAPENCSDC